MYRALQPIYPHVRAGSTGRPLRFASARGALILVAFAAAFGCGDSPLRGASSTQSGAAPNPSQPNIIIIVADALRADRLGSLGNAAKLTPTLDALAAEGVLFERAYSAAPWTLPSVASLLTSYYPAVHKATEYVTEAAFRGGHIRSVSILGETFDTLPEVLKSAGYTTAIVSANRFVQPELGFGQGVDHFSGDIAANTVDGRVVNDEIAKWLDQRPKDRPFLLYAHYMDIHGPYNAAPEFMDPLIDAVEKLPNKRRLSADEWNRLLPYLRKPPPHGDPRRHEALMPYREYWEARYDAGVAQFDGYLAKLIERLRADGLWRDSYVIFCSDHGEALCEHGLWDHGYSQYDTDIHVPLILRWPGELPAGHRVHENVRLIDVMPTLLEQLQVGRTNGLQGASLLQKIFAPSPRKVTDIFAEAPKSGPPQFASIRGNWKLIQIEPVNSGPRVHLFKLDEDPGEQRDLARPEIDRVRSFLQKLRVQRQANATLRPDAVAVQRDVPKDAASRFHGLGYAAGADDEEVGEAPAPDEPAHSQPASQPASREQPADAGSLPGSQPAPRTDVP